MNRDLEMNDENRIEAGETKPNHPLAPLPSNPVDELSSYKDRSTNPGSYKLNPDEIDELGARWSTIQSQFVDQPCTSIEQADALLADTLERIHQGFTQHHSSLRDRWYDQQDVSTEELRLTLQDYRAFLNNLLDK